MKKKVLSSVLSILLVSGGLYASTSISYANKLVANNDEFPPLEVDTNDIYFKSEYIFALREKNPKRNKQFKFDADLEADSIISIEKFVDLEDEDLGGTINTNLLKIFSVASIGDPDNPCLAETGASSIACSLYMDLDSLDFELGALLQEKGVKVNYTAVVGTLEEPSSSSVITMAEVVNFDDLASKGALAVGFETTNTYRLDYKTSLVERVGSLSALQKRLGLKYPELTGNVSTVNSVRSNNGVRLPANGYSFSDSPERAGPVIFEAFYATIGNISGDEGRYPGVNLDHIEVRVPESSTWNANKGLQAAEPFLMDKDVFDADKKSSGPLVYLNSDVNTSAHNVFTSMLNVRFVEDGVSPPMNAGGKVAPGVNGSSIINDSAASPGSGVFSVMPHLGNNASALGGKAALTGIINIAQNVADVPFLETDISPMLMGFPYEHNILTRAIAFDDATYNIYRIIALQEDRDNPAGNTVRRNQDGDTGDKKFEFVGSDNPAEGNFLKADAPDVEVVTRDMYEKSQSHTFKLQTKGDTIQKDIAVPIEYLLDFTEISLPGLGNIVRIYFADSFLEYLKTSDMNFFNDLSKVTLASSDPDNASVENDGKVQQDSDKYYFEIKLADSFDKTKPILPVLTLENSNISNFTSVAYTGFTVETPPPALVGEDGNPVDSLTLPTGVAGMFYSQRIFVNESVASLTMDSKVDFPEGLLINMNPTIEDGKRFFVIHGIFQDDIKDYNLSLTPKDGMSNSGNSVNVALNAQSFIDGETTLPVGVIGQPYEANLKLNLDALGDRNLGIILNNDTAVFADALKNLNLDLTVVPAYLEEKPFLKITGTPNNVFNNEIFFKASWDTEMTINSNSGKSLNTKTTTSHGISLAINSSPPMGGTPEILDPDGNPVVSLELPAGIAGMPYSQDIRVSKDTVSLKVAENSDLPEGLKFSDAFVDQASGDTFVNLGGFLEDAIAGFTFNIVPLSGAIGESVSVTLDSRSFLPEGQRLPDMKVGQPYLARIDLDLDTLGDHVENILADSDTTIVADNLPSGLKADIVAFDGQDIEDYYLVISGTPEKATVGDWSDIVFVALWNDTQSLAGKSAYSDLYGNSSTSHPVVARALGVNVTIPDPDLDIYDEPKDRYYPKGNNSNLLARTGVSISAIALLVLTFFSAGMLLRRRRVAPKHL